MDRKFHHTFSFIIELIFSTSLSRISHHFFDWRNNCVDLTVIVRERDREREGREREYALDDVQPQNRDFLDSLTKAIK